MRTLGRILGLLALGTILSACNNDKTGGGSSSDKPYVAFISNNPHEFWSIARKGTEAAAKEFNVKVDFMMPPNGTIDDQRRFIEDLENKGVKAIAISPNDSANQVGFFKEVNSKLPLLAVDNDI